MTAGSNPPYALSASEARSAGSSADAVSIFRMLVYCSSRLRYRFDQRLAEDDLTSQQGILLTVVRTRGQPKLGEVATAMATSHTKCLVAAESCLRKNTLVAASNSSAVPLIAESISSKLETLLTEIRMNNARFISATLLPGVFDQRNQTIAFFMADIVFSRVQMGGERFFK